MNAATELYSQALSLPIEQREELALMLLESLPDTGDAPIEVSAELEQEIDRRIGEREAGSAQTVDLATFAAAVRAAAQPPASP
jgi:hypothetical protein